MKALLLIIDSFGIGALPDADRYGDAGANPSLHICEAIPGEKWPHLKHLGLGNCANLLGDTLPGCPASRTPAASVGVMNQASAGKDTISGHWEMAGIKLDKPFHIFNPSFPSFPEKLVKDFQKQTGYKLLGNKSASGTEIIEALGKAHLKGEGVIVYTSADSVFQIAAHEDIVPVKELYQICEIARKLCDPYHVGRVIARPFIGKPGQFKRTGSRKDYSMVPPQRSLLNHLQNHHIQTIGIGKIGNIFSEQGLETSFHDSENSACLNRTIDCLQKRTTKDQFIFVNLVDTDMLYGHRRDIKGYYKAVCEIDEMLPEIVESMNFEDLMIITADHGCDPGFRGTDHTREYVPLLVYQKIHKPVELGIRASFCDVAQSITAFFGLPRIENGQSFI